MDADTQNKIQQRARESDICYIWIIYKNHFQRHCPRVSLATPMHEFGMDMRRFSKLIQTHIAGTVFSFLHGDTNLYS